MRGLYSVHSQEVLPRPRRVLKFRQPARIRAAIRLDLARDCPRTASECSSGGRAGVGQVGAWYRLNPLHLFANLAIRDFQIVFRPQVLPKLCTRPEVPREPQRHLIVLKFGSSVLGSCADLAVPASASCLSLWRSARDNGLWSRSACDGRRRKDRQVGVAALKSIEADPAIADRGELTAQETWRGAVLGCRRETVDDADAGVGLERGDQVVEEAVGLCDLVIHVHQNRNVNRAGWQLWIVRLTEGDGDVLQSEITHPFAQALQVRRHDVFGDDPAVRSDNGR